MTLEKSLFRAYAHQELMSVEEKILAVLERNPRGMGITGLVKETGLKKSEVTKALTSLVEKGRVAMEVKGCRAVYTLKK